MARAQLGLAHSYSRAKVKFNVNKSDNMIIQVRQLQGSRRPCAEGRGAEGRASLPAPSTALRAHAPPAQSAGAAAARERTRCARPAPRRPLRCWTHWTRT